MIAAFFVVAAYLGFADLGSRLLDAPPPPVSALRAPERLATIDVVTAEAGAPQRSTER